MFGLGMEYHDSQQQKIRTDYERRQVKTMEEHADKNRDAGDILFEKAKQRALEGDVRGSIKASSEAGNQYIKATEKISKANLIANYKESSTYGKISAKKVIETHSIKVVNKELGNRALLSVEDEIIMDNITGNSGLDYINLEYGNKNNEPVSINLKQCSELKERCEKAFNIYEDQKHKEQRKQKRQQMVNYIDGYFNVTLGY